MPDVQIIGLTNVADGIQRAGILNPAICHAFLVNERCCRGSNQLIILGRNDSDTVAGLRNRGTIIQALDGWAIGAEIVASRATEGIEHFTNGCARPIAELVCEIVDAGECSGMGRRGDSCDLVDQVGDAFKLGHVERLESTLGVADDVNFALAGLFHDFFDVGGNLGGTLVDCFQAAKQWETIVCTVSPSICAEALSLQPVLHVVQVLIKSRAKAVEEDNGVVGALAGEIVDSCCDGCGGREGRERQLDE